MITKLDPGRDEYLFMRVRAMQLLDEGLTRQARRLLAAIDRAQARRVAEALQEMRSDQASGDR
jgi:hypothetical protein